MTMRTASILALSLAAPASAQLAINWQTIDAGGGDSTSGALRVRATLGQPDAGVMSAGSLTLHGGFWFGTPEPVACYPDCDNTGVLDFFDFLCFQNAFNATDPYADCDQSGLFDFFDFLCFINAFNDGCP